MNRHSGPAPAGPIGALRPAERARGPRTPGARAHRKPEPRRVRRPAVTGERGTAAVGAAAWARDSGDARDLMETPDPTGAATGRAGAG